MADIRNFPAEPVAPIAPELPGDELERLQAENEDLRTENQRLRAYLNNLEKLTQRVLALRANRGRLLWLAIGAAVLLYLSVPGTWGNQLVAGVVHKLFPTPQVHAFHRPAVKDLPDIPPESPTAAPSTPISAVPSASPLNSPAAPSPLPIASRPSPLPLPLPSICNGNHLPTDPICPPMGHRPRPSPSLPI